MPSDDPVDLLRARHHILENRVLQPPVKRLIETKLNALNKYSDDRRVM
jgi:hypothetical protein